MLQDTADHSHQHTFRRNKLVSKHVDKDLKLR